MDEQSGLVGLPGSSWMLFVPVPEHKSVKNPRHRARRPDPRRVVNPTAVAVDRLVTLLALGKSSIHELTPDDVILSPGFTRDLGADVPGGRTDLDSTG